ncbi:hypothetical protein B5F10_11010 [Anaerotruncus colihominis]|uniref:Uncharacterized protein n=1 Tax=Anaerotruncus colihominis TaxID=169435 RepID=A0A174TGP2_9FIRM|nr:hypothetical protein B5F55_15195 [Anaerotruncus colihominis]OUP68814.1 hypothetical protein B5F11_11880 [Anaerotruncus colihominis]OUP73429.1 hypothetical protein B5F10_11010 [Anaerotruncus colihominis]CUQ08922.1 Uncharacterised protein [Anaerotruncus colihominis]
MQKDPRGRRTPAFSSCIHSLWMLDKRGIFPAGQGAFLQAGCRPAKKFNAKRGKKPAWTVPNGFEYRFLHRN